MPLSRTSYAHALTTVRIATPTTPWCVSRSYCNQRCYIALRNRGTPVLMSARCHNQTSCHNWWTLLREREFGAPQPNDSAIEKWEILRDPMHSIALALFGKNTSRTHDWFDAKSSEMAPVIEAKRIAPP